MHLNTNIDGQCVSGKNVSKVRLRKSNGEWQLHFDTKDEYTGVCVILTDMEARKVANLLAEVPVETPSATIIAEHIE